MDRSVFLQEIEKGLPWDILVIGGGATGLGIAVDAASRGCRVLLLEQADFAKGTSSRSTKLVHGGVRYLAQGNLKLVLEALRERGHLLQNAPHVTGRQSFIIPVYSWWKAFLYTIGLKIYDWMAGRWRIGNSRFLTAREVKERMPAARQKGLKGGVLYYDGQFDDARLAINLAQTCVDHGGIVLNYAKVTGLKKNENGKVCGATFLDTETGRKYSIESKVVINATGVFVDDLLALDNAGHTATVQPSQGVHVVLDRTPWQGSRDAMMIPSTNDGRVLFIVPWHGKLLAGTTDTPLQTHSLEPHALDAEVAFILETAGRFLTQPPHRGDVLSVFAGLRPLALPDKRVTSTKDISRSHKLVVSASGMITITGGKWTTYRLMAEDTMRLAMQITGLPSVSCVTKTLPIHGFLKDGFAEDDQLRVYGNDLAGIQALERKEPNAARKLDNAYPYTHAQVIWAAREEMARTVEDVLARRLRILFLDAKSAVRMAPVVASILAMELGKTAEWKQQQIADFKKLAAHYIITG